MTDLQEHGQIDDGGSIENLYYFPLYGRIGSPSYISGWLPDS